MTTKYLINVLFLGLTVGFLNSAKSHVTESLKFPNDSREFRVFASIANGVFHPKEGISPFPAVVLLHTCGGISNEHAKKLNEPSLRKWIESLNKNGFIVLVIDHFTGRTTDNNCAGKRSVSNEQMFYDIHDAVEHLTKNMNVDKKRIFVLGFSLGGQMAGMAASPKVYQEWGKNKQRPRAVASLYGGCLYKSGQYLYTDSDLPVLWLMGGQDRESPPEECLKIIESASQKNIKWHIYPEGYHNWDNQMSHRSSRTLTRADGSKENIEYRFDESITRDSEKRIIDFFNSLQ